MWRWLSWRVWVGVSHEGAVRLLSGDLSPPHMGFSTALCLFNMLTGSPSLTPRKILKRESKEEATVTLMTSDVPDATTSDVT